MLFRVLFVSTLLYKVICGEGTEKKSKPLSFPVPFELPRRNDRAEQCWLRIEDVELTETVATYCTIAQAFLGYYIHDYNTRKITEDGIDVSLWVEKPRGPNDAAYGPPDVVNGVKNWRVATLMDPITKRRLYVSKDADCRLIMYTREAVTNYRVDCETILYFINEHVTGSAVFSRSQISILVSCIFFVYLII